ncbi:MAG: hypothetical protein AB1941_02890 [Gemmatimonadota bacterium]
MEFLNSVKGSVAQTMIHCLLRHSGYLVVPTSIEALIPSLTLRDWAGYDALNLGPELRLLPDLLLLPPEGSARLAEVKYRTRLDRETIRRMLEKCRAQQEHFPDAYTILVRGSSPRGAAARADDLVRVLPPNALELLAAADLYFNAITPAPGGSDETRLEPLWQSLRPMTSVFDRLQGQRETLEQLVPLIRALATL